ncbi:hypothetical protein ES705_11483 [subsurface metagenome]|nr:hypothetical protein [Methanosarcinales archaeon]
MKLFRKLISLEDALKIALSNAKRTEIEEIVFDDALNRVLAEDVCSSIDSPPFDRAAMDGYAIRGEDSFGASPNNPVFLRKRSRKGGEKENEIGNGNFITAFSPKIKRSFSYSTQFIQTILHTFPTRNA